MLNTAIKIISFPIALFITVRDFRPSPPSAAVSAVSVASETPAHLVSQVSRTGTQEEVTDREWDFPEDFAGQNAGGGYPNR
jgi:hypothetical protein